MSAGTPAPGAVTIVTQTRVASEKDVHFAAWQEEMSKTIARHAGFIDQKVIPPSPPGQVDWVVLQRFSGMDAAKAWMHSPERLALMHTAQPLLAGNDDIHIIPDGGGGVLPSPVSAVISTRVKPGQETAYREWERRMAAAQARAPGFQGYRIEPPVAGVQDSWLAIVRFDSDEHLDAWMKSPERLALLPEGEKLSDEVHARIVRSGFDQWFSQNSAPGRAPPPPWKMNMLVLSILYPVVFLFGMAVMDPFLLKTLHMPFWLALFTANTASILVLNYLVPWASARFGWWLQPDPNDAGKVDMKGVACMFAIYAVAMLIFSRL